MDKTPKIRMESFRLENSEHMLALAGDLSKFIKDNKLYHNIQGKEFVNVEGWQYAGARLAIVPVVEELACLSKDDEICYRAKVVLLNLHTSTYVGGSYAICSNKEQGKKFYQEFAIASMAQTRAIGKALRNLLSWVVKAAGYEPVSVEEVDWMTAENPDGMVVGSGELAKNAKTAANPEAQKAAMKKATSEPMRGQLISAGRKAEILSFCNHQYVTDEEREKVVAIINTLDEEKADRLVAKMQRAVKVREDLAAAEEKALKKGKPATDGESLDFPESGQGDGFFDEPFAD